MNLSKTLHAHEKREVFAALVQPSFRLSPLPSRAAPGRNNVLGHIGTID